ncbi:MAG: hypothetical protein AAF577_11020 [Pseudomonadota bacterium]
MPDRVAEGSAGPAVADTVHILMVEVGRKEGDGLPEDATGAALVCYCAAPTEKGAVDATVQVLREAGLAPLQVEAWGTVDAPDAPEGFALDSAIATRAAAENAVVVAHLNTFTT